MKKLKEKKKFILGLIIGLIFGGITIYSATILFGSDSVTFDNTHSNLTIDENSVTNVQDAIDALYSKAFSGCEDGYVKGETTDVGYSCVAAS